MNWLAVAVGGALGACLRYGLGLALASVGMRFPLGTFSANVIGCFVMGLGFVFFLERGDLSNPWRYFLLVGVLGAFTTFSSFSIEVLNLFQEALIKQAIFYVFLSVFVCLCSTSIGVLVGRYFFH